ncbi:hypothetical protein ACSFA3_02085 [Variovorax sp. RHLX14]|uniref:hypothetical protein n=1 Tax=Variovorax sp. RHLX14 TaxID=1259731 RepID=UPI003F478BB4
MAGAFGDIPPILAGGHADAEIRAFAALTCSIGCTELNFICFPDFGSMKKWNAARDLRACHPRFF